MSKPRAAKGKIKKKAKPVATKKVISKADDPESLITAAQLESIATVLKTSPSSNVFRVAERFVDTAVVKQLGDKLFELLEEKHDLFHCETCSRWMALSEKSEHDPEVCDSCECDRRALEDEENSEEDYDD
jgi:hypothetical protein